MSRASRAIPLRVMKADDDKWMARALALAARGSGETNPNPMVGCVIVKRGRVVGEGYHARAGGPHAEVVALGRAGARARGATLYVNLEPCSHHGRTPPCAPRLHMAGLRRVVVAVRDPNPRVDGRGLALLRRAGIAVTVGVRAREAVLLNERFFVASRRGRPFLLLKAALTLDGRIATARRESKWITGPASRRAARALRRLHDAVLVGIGTVLADDPLLLPVPAVRRPFVRVVLDTHLRLPTGSRLVRSAARSPVWVVCAAPNTRRRRRLEARGVTVIASPRRAPRVPLPWAVRKLGRRGLTSVMVEGGSEVLGSFLAARLVDQVALFRAPLLLGGRGSLPAFGGENPVRVADGLRMGPARPRARAWGLPRSGPPDPLFELWYPVTGGPRRGSRKRRAGGAKAPRRV